MGAWRVLGGVGVGLGDAAGKDAETESAKGYAGDEGDGLAPGEV